MMKYRNDTARTFASVWFLLAFVAVVTPGSADARQEPTTTEEATVPVYEVRDVEELGLWTSVKWAFQWYVNPRALTDVALLHAYELSTVCEAVGQIRDPRAFGRAAIVTNLAEWENWVEQEQVVERYDGESQPGATNQLGAQYFPNTTVALRESADRYNVRCDSENTRDLEDWSIATRYPIPGVPLKRRLFSEGEVLLHPTWQSTTRRLNTSRTTAK